MKIIYIKEREEIYNGIKKMILNIERIFNVIKVEKNSDKTMYYLPILKETKVSNYRIKRICNKINLLLEEEGATTVVLSKYLEENYLLKNYLYSNNINVLNGRFLFKNLVFQIISYIFKIRNEEMNLRRSIIFD